MATPRALISLWNSNGSNWGRGSLRLGHITLLPGLSIPAGWPFPPPMAALTPEHFSLADQTVEHGAPVSFLVSATCALGLTEGWLELADGATDAN